MKGNIFHELAAFSLRKAKDQFYRNRCNHLDDDEAMIIQNWSISQKGYFIEFADKWNNGPMGLEPETLHLIEDWVLMGILSYILENESDYE